MLRPKFFIGRYPDKESLVHVKSAQEKLRDIEKITIVHEPHLTYAGSKPIAKATLNLSAENLNMLIHPLPATAPDTLTLGVKGLKSVQGRRLLPYLVIDLEDPEGVYADERRAIMGRVERYLPIGTTKDIPPHVSLGRVGIESLSLDLVNQIEEELPTSLNFQPISFPQYTDENVGDVTDQEKLTPRKPTRIIRAPVPQGLLNSFRTTHE